MDEIFYMREAGSAREYPPSVNHIFREYPPSHICHKLIGNDLIYCNKAVDWRLLDVTHALICKKMLETNISTAAKAPLIGAFLTLHTH